ncbi:beta-lactamase class A [Caloramator quimbayensis]|uniref:Beta-lactamase class A n=1 Tax=Caloramator quimbayensis TaxID=1147123 RepID=A0A1T4WDN7_9CLOT|nr:serine hydrolase [Caloramator quimbayensis]SKA75400.1 beta-lactamase class A [Caloramator quimbayensis]
MFDNIRGIMEKHDIKYSLIVKNLSTGEMLNINGDTSIPSASTIKVFIMAEAFRQAKEGKISLKERIKVDKSYHVPYSIISLLSEDNTYTIMDLITLMIIQSDNTSTNVLIDILGMGKINDYIKSLGCSLTVLERKMMDFIARDKGLENKTCARDLTLFMELLYKGEVVDESSSKIMMDILKHQLDTSMMAYFIPEEVSIAHKTGEVSRVDHDFGIVFLDNLDYIFTMMTYDVKSNNDARFAIAQVSKEVYDYFIESYKSF